MGKNLTERVADSGTVRSESGTVSPHPEAGKTSSLDQFRRWLTGRLRSFAHAGRGLFVLCIRERNFQIHLVAAVLAVVLAIFFQLSSVEWSILVLTIFAVLTAETFNSVVEHLIDLVQPDRHPLVRDAKDLAAAAVLLVSIASAIIGAILFVPRIANLFK
jgi:undecaprenol kinase